MVQNLNAGPPFPERLCDTMWDAPPVNEYLSESGADEITYIVGSIRAFMTNKKVREDYPDRWEILVTVFQKVMENEEAVAALSEAGIGTEWLGLDGTLELVRDTQDLMSPLVKSWSENN